jgi:hypothetical protein
MRYRKLYKSRKSCVNKSLLQQKNVFQTFLLWFCSFFCYFFRSTEVCFSQCISYSRVFRFEHIYKCSTWSLLFGDMIELNKCYVVEINNWKQKSGARLLTSTVVLCVWNVKKQNIEEALNILQSIIDETSRLLKLILFGSRSTMFLVFTVDLWLTRISPIRLSPTGHSPMAKVHCTFANIP